jgi:hypothetical protein
MFKSMPGEKRRVASLDSFWEEEPEFVLYVVLESFSAFIEGVLNFNELNYGV